MGRAKNEVSATGLAAAEVIREMKDAQGLSGRELAERIGRSQHHVAARLRGEIEMNVGDLKAFAAALGVPTLTLFAKIDERELSQR